MQRLWSKIPCWRKPQTRQKVHTKVGNPLHHRKKIDNARHRCLVGLSCQAPRAIEILQLSPQRFHDQEVGRVIAAARETPRFGQRMNAESFDHFRSVSKQNIEYLRRASYKMRGSSRRLILAEVRTKQEFGVTNVQIHREASLKPPSANESDEDDVDDGSLLDRAQQDPDHDPNAPHAVKHTSTAQLHLHLPRKYCLGDQKQPWQGCCYCGQWESDAERLLLS